MLPTMNCNRGDVILVRFPFTDLKAGKGRPAVVVSTAEYNRAGDDVIATAVTGNLKAAWHPGDYLLEGWRGAGLLKESLAKSVVFTIEKSLVTHKLGKLSKIDMQGVSRGLLIALGLEA